MVTSIEADFKEITITHDKTECNIQYVFEGVGRQAQILTVNKMPIYFFEEHVIEDFYYAIGEALIEESIDYKEYIEEQRGDESRHN